MSLTKAGVDWRTQQVVDVKRLDSFQSVISGRVIEHMNAEVAERLRPQTFQTGCDIRGTVEGDNVDGNLHHAISAPNSTLLYPSMYAGRAIILPTAPTTIEARTTTTSYQSNHFFAYRN